MKTTQTHKQIGLRTNRIRQTILGLCLVWTTSKVVAQNSYTLNTTTADAFLASGSAGNPHGNYSLPLDAGLVTDAAGGGEISLYFYAADNQVSYLFNARNIHVTWPLPLTVNLAADKVQNFLLGFGHETTGNHPLFFPVNTSPP